MRNLYEILDDDQQCIEITHVSVDKPNDKY